jgi:aldose 1-epimerase
MFEISTDAFGRFKRYTLAHSNVPLKIQFVPERGGCLLSLVMEGEEVLDGYQTPEELDFNNWGKSGVLYPFPNRLKDGRFTWQGKTYQFPTNDATHQNALHGFGMQRPLEVMEVEVDEDNAKIRLEGKYTGDHAHYPWPFTFGLTYELHAPNQLWVKFSLRNDADVAIPAGLGWHPYFQLAEIAAAHTLRLPQVEMVGIDARMIPTGKRYEYGDFLTPKLIGATVLDNCFAVPNTAKEVSAHLSGSRGTLRYWQETGKDKFNFLQVFTPPYGTSVALEPMTCNVDAFNNGEGLVTLAPGATLQAKAGVVYEVE